jgi:DNA-binding transcriptional LysR family regulator
MNDGAQVEEIEAFAAVAESGSFAAAGLRLGRDSSVLSRRVTALEARLNVRLLARTTRQVSVTEVGAGYLVRVQAILAEWAAADAEASKGAAAPRGVLRLALPAAFGRMWIAPLLPAFLVKYPDIQIDAQYSDRYVDMTAERVDAAVRVGMLPPSGLVARRLARFSRLLCASPAYVAERGAPATPEDLTGHACLGFTRHRFWPNWPLRRGTERVEVHVNGSLVSDDGEALAAAAVGGAGIMLASEWLVKRQLVDGQLTQVLPDWSVEDDEAGSVSAVLPPGRLVPAKTRAFVDWLATAFVPAPWSLSDEHEESSSRFQG